MLITTTSTSIDLLGTSVLKYYMTCLKSRNVSAIHTYILAPSSTSLFIRLIITIERERVLVSLQCVVPHGNSNLSFLAIIDSLLAINSVRIEPGRESNSVPGPRRVSWYYSDCSLRGKSR